MLRVIHTDDSSSGFRAELSSSLSLERGRLQTVDQAVIRELVQRINMICDDGVQGELSQGSSVDQDQISSAPMFMVTAVPTLSDCDCSNAKPARLSYHLP